MTDQDAKRLADVVLEVDQKAAMLLQFPRVQTAQAYLDALAKHDKVVKELRPR